VSDKPLCPYCKSPDTVSYWNTKDGQEGTPAHDMLKSIYPNALVCVDCEAVVPDPERVVPMLRLADIMKAPDDGDFSYSIIRAEDCPPLKFGGEDK
jgi:RNA polymerase subunit RPABC4/transcription elongation factor Spt4